MYYRYLAPLGFVFATSTAAGTPGQTRHGVYKWSEVKNMLESQDRFLCAGDSGYAMNHVIIKPYTQGEVMDNNSKSVFNTQHARLRHSP